VGRCPDCGEFDTFVEDREQVVSSSSSGGPSVRPTTLSEVVAGDEDRVPTGVAEFDRVLGGGLVEGSLVLLGGEPGIGKSTLLLQAAEAMSRADRDVMYVCGEESPTQVKLRADRLGARGDRVRLLPEVDVRAVEAAVGAATPDVLIVDSIQTLFDPDLPNAPGSVGQVRSCTTRLQRMAKQDGITVVIVGHVTKEGSIAGPRVLEHIVDTVLYFEGDAERLFRVVRAAKNRFGSVSEIGLFEMGESGLVGVGSPSEALLPHRDGDVAGSMIVAAMEGSRPVLVELQALVTPSYGDVPRRHATGVDRNRVLQVIAVLERRAGVDFAGHDVYVSVVGGVRVSEPAVDLPLALALHSARRDVAWKAGSAAFGEVGLTGEIRSVPNGERRLREADRLGMSLVVAPAGVPSETDGVRVAQVSRLREALEFAGAAGA
jgi:DNA repair protein RadA/Sms